MVRLESDWPRLLSTPHCPYIYMVDCHREPYSVIYLLALLTYIPDEWTCLVGLLYPKFVVLDMAGHNTHNWCLLMLYCAKVMCLIQDFCTI